MTSEPRSLAASPCRGSRYQPWPQSCIAVLMACSVPNRANLPAKNASETPRVVLRWFAWLPSYGGKPVTAVHRHRRSAATGLEDLN